MPFLRQAHGVKLRSLPNNVVLYPSTVRFASHSNRHKKNHVARDSQEKARSGHHEAAHGKRQKPFWKSITPDFLTQETDASLRKSGHFAQVSAFKLYTSHKSGSKPIVEASSASWDSKTNAVSHTVYDPISGRMVPANNEQSRQKSTSAKSKKDTHTDKTYQKPTIVSQPPENIEALSNTSTSHASFTEDFDKIYQSEHDELLAARRHLDTLREQIQILERQTHPEMTKPHYAVDAERPAVFEDGWDNNPKGLETAFKLEKEACEHGEMRPLEQELDALNKRPAQEVNDGYSIAPSGLETLFANEQKGDDISHKSSLEQELVAMNTKPPPLDDGYSPSPQGLETLFEQEQHTTGQGERKSLEDEVRMTGSTTGQPQHIDGLSKEPTGLETMYEREQQGTPQRLEHELENMASSAVVSDPGDVYSNEPTRMQAIYERETEVNQKRQHTDLEHEIHDHVQALDDSPANLNGMQTLWKREQENVENGSARSLEDEIKAKQQSQVNPNEDDPFGMETHFRNEVQSTGDGKSKTLEEEISRIVQAQVREDDQSCSQKGLETSFQNEEKDANLGKRQNLEKEMDSREPGFEDGYSTMPMGLQMMFRREKQSDGRSLEEDLKQMEEASYHEDGYSRAPIGMESSFEKEANDESTSLEADLKDMPGEGDLSPTVGKFAARDQWYKQPARSTFSENSSKADVRELNQHTAIFGRPLDGGSSESVQSSVASPESAATTEHPSTTTTSISDSIHSSSKPKPDPDMTWAEPALYKVLAYDSKSDFLTMTTTSSNFSESDAPLSIPQAISQLTQIARFLPHLASLQNGGFQITHAAKDYLILRKMHANAEPKTPQYGGGINPVDGTARNDPIEPPTARFASPTGFVNYEPIFPTEAAHKRKDAFNPFSDITTNKLPRGPEHEYYIDPKGGARLRLTDEYARFEKRQRWRRRMLWILSVAAGTAVSTTYIVGVSGELARSDKHIPPATR